MGKVTDFFHIFAHEMKEKHDIMADRKYPKEFEEYWKEHEQALLEAAPATLREERKDNGKMNTTGDWLLFIVPFFVGIGFLNAQIIKAEMANFIVSIIVVVVSYGIAMMIRPYVTGKRSIADIDADIKNHYLAVYEESGVDGLRKIIG